jgi:hypothetical protein
MVHNNTDELHSFISQISVGGGGDPCEDLCGAVDVAIKMFIKHDQTHDYKNVICKRSLLFFTDTGDHGKGFNT